MSEEPKKTWDQQWAALSPFVRAGVAAHAAEMLAQSAGADTNSAKWAKRCGMPRRARIATEFVKAKALLGGMLVAIANEADDECAELLGEENEK